VSNKALSLVTCTRTCSNKIQ